MLARPLQPQVLTSDNGGYVKNYKGGCLNQDYSGPVSEDSVIGVALGPDDGADGLAPLFGSVGILDLHRQPDEVPGVEAVRLFAGYAGWTGGQLEDEMAEQVDLSAPQEDFQNVVMGGMKVLVAALEVHVDAGEIEMRQLDRLLAQRAERHRHASAVEPEEVRRPEVRRVGDPQAAHLEPAAEQLHIGAGWLAGRGEKVL